MSSVRWQRCLALLVGLALHAQFLAATAALAHWTVNQSVEGSALMRAQLEGQATHGSHQGMAELQADCRADAESARLNVQFSPKTLKFKVEAYEGPGGFGETHDVLDLRVGGGEAKPHNASGYFIDNDLFVFSTALNSAETQSLLRGGQMQKVELTVEAMKGNAPLVAAFDLPPATQEVGQVLSPCMNKQAPEDTASVYTDKDLVTKDEELLNELSSLQKSHKSGEISSEDYREGLKRLSGREEQLFALVRRHHFLDKTAYNYFFRMRLKFPSAIAQAAQAVEQ